MATPSPRPAPADWKGAAAVLAAAEALPDAEADDEAEADEADADADAAEAEDWEAVADAEDEADEPDEGQLGLVLSSTLEPLHRAVARVMVLSVSAWLQLLRTQQEILEMFSLLQMQVISTALQVPILFA
jgi:hypothetical protein